MLHVAEILGKSFERILRWVYPGVLFTALLCLGRPGIFDFWLRRGVWQDHILIAALVITAASVVIYALHRYVLKDFLRWLLYMVGWASFQRANKKIPLFDKYIGLKGKDIIRRFGGLERESPDLRESRISNYLIGRWAAIHAMGLTAWVFVAMYLVALPSSPLREGMPLWLVVLIPSILGLWWLFQTTLLEHTENEYFYGGGGSSINS